MAAIHNPETRHNLQQDLSVLPPHPKLGTLIQYLQNPVVENSMVHKCHYPATCAGRFARAGFMTEIWTQGKDTMISGSGHNGFPGVLALGRLTAGTIQMGVADDASSWTPAIVDWDFATINGKGINGDIVQFLAHIRCEMITTQNKHQQKALRTFMGSFIESYSQSSRIAASNNWPLVRSALLNHGIHLERFAWSEYFDHPSFKQILELSEWYLSHAGRNTGAFQDPGNLRALGDEPDFMIRSLFVQPSTTDDGPGSPADNLGGGAPLQSHSRVTSEVGSQNDSQADTLRDQPQQSSAPETSTRSQRKAKRRRRNRSKKRNDRNDRNNRNNR